MRFLCLHGVGSNSNIFETQTAAVRYELGSHHTYDFVEGTVPAEASTHEFINPTDETFAWCDPLVPESCLRLDTYIDRYIEEEGPYDGIIGFSSGSLVILSWLIEKYRRGKANRLPIKLAIFFSTSYEPWDIDALRHGRISHLDCSSVSEILDLPTVHIWGSMDDLQEHACKALGFCNKKKMSSFVHDKGHEVPVSTKDVVYMARAINRAIEQV